jgi:hypothetical protein
LETNLFQPVVVQNVATVEHIRRFAHVRKYAVVVKILELVPLRQNNDSMRIQCSGIRVA